MFLLAASLLDKTFMSELSDDDHHLIYDCFSSHCIEFKL